MAERIHTQETADGVAYTFKGYTIVFPYGNARPYLLWGSGVVRIDDPERFGDTDTVQARHAFMRAFVGTANHSGDIEAVTDPDHGFDENSKLYA